MFRKGAPMLAEKFFLLLETIRSHSYPDGSPIAVSSSPHVPIKLPSSSGEAGVTGYRLIVGPVGPERPLTSDYPAENASATFQ
jgi:hypothetical protein